MSIDDCRIISLPKILDDRGNLSFIEAGRPIPFVIKRVYWIYDVPGGATRGGPANKLSVLELINWLKSEMNQKIDFSFSDWRPGDQPVYFSNIGKIAKDLDWRPAISREYGMKRLYLWIKENIDEIRRTLD
jgi:nucleoside-diphosphate-sugar epimerase